MNAAKTPNAGADLIRLHKTITRGLSVAQRECQGDGPQVDQRRGLQLYVQALTALLHAHHLGEDEISFPFWKGRVPQSELDTLAQQHQKMMPLLEKVEAWLASNGAAWEADGLAMLKGTLGELDALWHTHIQLEENTLGPENSAQFLTPEENLQLAQQLAAHGQQHSNPAELVLPFVLYNLEGEDRQGMIATLPTELAQHVIPVVWKPAWAPMQPFLLA
jgi:hypothetical protein